MKIDYKVVESHDVIIVWCIWDVTSFKHFSDHWIGDSLLLLFSFTCKTSHNYRAWQWINSNIVEIQFHKYMYIIWNSSYMYIIPPSNRAWQYWLNLS